MSALGAITSTTGATGTSAWPNGGSASTAAETRASDAHRRTTTGSDPSTTSTTAVIVGALLAAAPHPAPLVAAGVPLERTSTRAVDARLASITGSIARGLPATSTAATTAAVDRTRSGRVDEPGAAATTRAHRAEARPGPLDGVGVAAGALAAQTGFDRLRATRLIGID